LTKCVCAVLYDKFVVELSILCDVQNDRCVVWTGDERVFFYNPSQNVSVWDCPEDIEDRADVKKLMQTPPRLMQQAAAAAAVSGNLSSALSFLSCNSVNINIYQFHRINDNTVKCSCLSAKLTQSVFCNRPETLELCRISCL